MTAYELARKLLDGPDIDVVISTGPHDDYEEITMTEILTCTDKRPYYQGFTSKTGKTLRLL